jgi:hypothetical protein
MKIENIAQSIAKAAQLCYTDSENSRTEKKT